MVDLIASVSDWGCPEKEKGRCGCRALVAVWDGSSSRHLESKRLAEMGGGVASLSFSPSPWSREICFSGAFFLLVGGNLSGLLP